MQYELEHGQITFCTLNDFLQPRDGSPIKLRHLEKLLLQALLNHVSDKREIIQYVWPKTVVSDGSYHKLVFDLRKQLDLVGLDPSTIKTIPRRGLAYNGHWSEKTPASKKVIFTLDDTQPDNMLHEPRLDTTNPLPGKAPVSQDRAVYAPQVMNHCKKLTMSFVNFLSTKIFKINPRLSMLYCLGGTISLALSLVLVVDY